MFVRNSPFSPISHLSSQQECIHNGIRNTEQRSSHQTNNVTHLLENITLSPMNVFLRLAILQHPNSLPHSLSNLIVHAGFSHRFRFRSTFNSFFKPTHFCTFLRRCFVSGSWISFKKGRGGGWFGLREGLEDVENDVSMETSSYCKTSGRFVGEGGLVGEGIICGASSELRSERCEYRSNSGGKGGGVGFGAVDRTCLFRRSISASLRLFSSWTTSICLYNRKGRKGADHHKVEFLLNLVYILERCFCPLFLLLRKEKPHSLYCKKYAGLRYLCLTQGSPTKSTTRWNWPGSQKTAYFELRIPWQLFDSTVNLQEANKKECWRIEGSFLAPASFYIRWSLSAAPGRFSTMILDLNSIRF